ncbi:MAG: radical SAM protein [Flavobacteriales bacterium]|nr:radical SAM protein [Flavobacteriales bacterium]
MITGIRNTLVQLRSWTDVRRIALDLYPDRREAQQAIAALRSLSLENRRIRHLTRSVKVDGRIHQVMSRPGWPSPAWDRFVRNELLRLRPAPGERPGIQVLIVAMTRKCPLACAHCCEGDHLNQRDVLSTDDVLAIIASFRARGCAQVELSGGEPLNRFNDLLRIVRESATEAMDLWVLSSGWGLTDERAAQLREAGLTGMSISVDHWDPEAHDRFRGRHGSFTHARNAVRQARKAGLVAAVSLVPTRSFCRLDDLLRYADMAADLGAHFIRIVEPRAAGNYADQDVELGGAEHAVLDQFVRLVHTDGRYRHHPIVDHYGSYQRAVGCSGAGRRFLYVDTNGEVMTCPFCRAGCGNALTTPLDLIEKELRERHGCARYATV